MPMKIGENYTNYSIDYLEKIQSRQENAKENENPANKNSITVLKDEYISSEKSGNKPSGLYRMVQDENGNPKVFMMIPKRQKSSQVVNR